MAKKKAPKWGHQSRHFLDLSGEEIYPPEVVESLAKEYGIPSEKINDLKKFLESAAKIYRNNTTNIDELPRVSEVRAALTEIHNLAEGLSWKLEHIDDVSWNHLWAAEGLVHQEALLGDKQESEYGHTFGRFELEDGSKSIQFLDRTDVEESVKILENYAKEAISKVPKDPGGNVTYHGLFMWVVNAQRFWVEKLGRKFSHFPSEGGGATEAYQFCWDALKDLNLNITKAQLGTQMRKVIRKRRGGKK